VRRFRVQLKDGSETAGIAFGDPVRPFEIVWLHATGFNAITYQSLLEPLGGQAHVAAIDLRGHGRSKLLANPARMHSWNRYRDDMIQILEQYAPEGTVLAGHSMGATVALLVAAKRPDLVRGLVMAEPVLLSKGALRWFNTPLLNKLVPLNKLAQGALRRRKTFPSPGDAAEALRGRGAFKTWRTPFLDDFVIDGVLRGDDGQYYLSCDPAWEAATFHAHRYRPWAAIRRLRKKRIPIILLQAEKDSTAHAETDRRVHHVRPDAAVTRVPGTSHFLPMERPYVVRDAMKLLYEATLEGAHDVDYVGAVRRTIDDNVGIMS
jgi:pimeloyl-ACP methyl ester carboxylesterase